MPQTILVTGATGQQGGAVVKYLTQASANVVALARDPSKAKLPAGVTVIKGDLADPSSLFQKPVDTLFLMIPSFSGDEAAMSKAIIDLAITKGVTYIVYSGVDLSGVDKHGIDTFDVKRDVWRYLQTLDVKSAYVGPAGFLETFFWPQLPEMTQSWAKTYKHKYIATEDIGHVAAVALLDRDRFAGREIMLAGDEVSSEDVRKAWKDIVGEDLGLVHPEEPYMKNLWQQLQTHPFEADVAACRREFPWLFDLRRWLKEVYLPAKPPRE